MKIDLTLHQYVDWRVTPVMPLKGKFGYRVFLVFMDGSEKPQQISGFTSQKEAEAARDRTVGELHSGTYVVYKNVIVKDFMEYWLEEDILQRVKSSETYATYKGMVHNHIIPVLGGRKMVDLTRANVQKLYNQKADYSESVARLVKTVMNVSMAYALSKKVITENPADGVNLPKSVEKKAYRTRNIDSRKTLTLEQMIKLIEASKKTPIYMQVLFNAMMGLRRREIIGVKFDDIDYINRKLDLHRQLGKKIRTKKEDFPPKTFTKQEIEMKTPSSYRDLPIPDYVFEAILEQRKIYERNRSRRGKDFLDAGYICCSSYGKPRSKDFHWKYYKKLLADNDLPDITWHNLRATFCTLLLKNGFSPKAVSKLMGHASELITVDVYGDNREIIADCTDVLAPYIAEVMPDLDEDWMIDTANLEVVIPAENYLL